MAKKVLEGTRDIKKVQVIRGQTDLRQVRCPHCSNMAIHIPNGRGGTKLKCQTCKAEFQTTSLE